MESSSNGKTRSFGLRNVGSTPALSARYFREIKMKLCKCGCGVEIEDTDKYGRPHEYINGHNGRKYKDQYQYQREYRNRNKDKIYKAKVERGHKLKAKVINLLGNKCTDCGLEYSGKNACVFQVHHINPKEKEISVNTRTLINYAWNKIEKELPKCILLCANCHFIEHNEEY